MKKKLIMGVAAMVCGIALAEESYLYWQINQDAAAEAIEFAYAQVKATKGGGDIYVGESATFSYADIAQYIWGQMGQTGASAWTVTAFNAVPEPTSGLLFLLGLAGLALRRKNV